MKTSRHILAILLLPGVVTVVVPFVIVRRTGTLNAGWSLPASLVLLPIVLG